jgi:hypothetical protein
MITGCIKMFNMKNLKLTKITQNSMSKVKGGNVPPVCVGCLCAGGSWQQSATSDAGSSKKT